jgi:hypothetical protein
MRSALVPPLARETGELRLNVTVLPEAEVLIPVPPARSMAPPDSVADPVSASKVRPPPFAPIVIEPAPLVTVIPVPAVIVERIGEEPVEPIGSCPLVATPRLDMLLVAFPIRSELLVVPDTLTVGAMVAVPVIVILLPPETEVTVPEPPPPPEVDN